MQFQDIQKRKIRSDSEYSSSNTEQSQPIEEETSIVFNVSGDDNKSIEFDKKSSKRSSEVLSKDYVRDGSKFPFSSQIEQKTKKR